jgi:hypothetical protein
MSLASALQPFVWNWVDNNGNTDLNVAGLVWDVTIETTPVLLATVEMYSVGNGAYSGSYQGVQNKNYIVQSSVYTDDTFTVLNPAFPPGAESFQCAPIAGSGGGGASCEVVGIIQNDNQLVGYVQSPLTLVGFIQCDGG